MRAYYYPGERKSAADPSRFVTESSGVAKGGQKGQLPPPPFFKENALEVEQSVTS